MTDCSVKLKEESCRTVLHTAHLNSGITGLRPDSIPEIRRCATPLKPAPVRSNSKNKKSDEKTPDNASETVEDAIRNKEGERLLKYIRDDAFVITLEIGGEQLTSENFARKINELGIRGTSHIQFVIGGSIGLGKEVLNRSDYALSFSKMTFPHQLMRVILLEQIYRSYRIISGEPYHK